MSAAETKALEIVAEKKAQVDGLIQQYVFYLFIYVFRTVYFVCLFFSHHVVMFWSPPCLSVHLFVYV